MPVTTLDGHQVHVNDEGFLTDPGAARSGGRVSPPR